VKIRGPLPEPKPTPHHPDEIKPGPLVLPHERVDAALATSLTREYVAPELVRLTSQTLALTRRFASETKAWAAAYEIDAEAAPGKIDRGEFLLEMEKLAPDPEVLGRLVDAAIELASFTEEAVQQAMKQWAAKVKNDDQTLIRLVTLNVQRTVEAVAEVAEATGLTPEAFYFILQQVGTAVLPAFAVQLAPLVDDEKWQHGTCPICGNGPVAAGLVGDGGRRHLVCDTCNFVWTFRRVMCPYCGNEDSDQLKVLAVDEDGPHRLDACDVCKRYVKTIDFRKADVKQAVIVPIEDAATVFLDIMAGNEGYTRD